MDTNQIDFGNNEANVTIYQELDRIISSRVNTSRNKIVLDNGMRRYKSIDIDINNSS